MSDNIQIFISYARNDDLPPPDGSTGLGFVTALQRQLRFELTNIGPPWPEVWWDRFGIDDADLFDPKIEAAINGSSLLIVVLSRNWLHSKYCQKELEIFRKRWASESDNDVQHRVKLVVKSDVEINSRPQLLTGQVGYKFFKTEDDEETPIFDRGREVDPLYTRQIRKLGKHLWRTADSLRRKTALPPEDSSIDDMRPLVEVPRNGRTIYLAQPARDMRRMYQRLRRELYEWGFEVVPGDQEDIPKDGPATGFIDGMMKDAEASIHLLGDDPGYAVNDAADQTVKLQLTRAARAEADGGKGFHRIIWAPKVMVEAADHTSAERNPVTVVQRFGSLLDSDKLEGDTSSRFIDFLRDHLKRTTPLQEKAVLSQITGDEKVYLFHAEEDTEYAAGIAEELQKFPKPIEALLPAFDGPLPEQTKVHRQNMQDCDAIVVCWASAPETWVKAHSYELKDWQGPVRPGKFAFRGLLAGPPPGSRKKILLRVPPRSQIDKVLDLTEITQPWPEALRNWFLGAQPDSPR